MNTRAVPVLRAALDDVEGTLCQVAAEVRAYLEPLTLEQWQQPVQDDPPLTLEGCIYGLLEHEIEHHGMIRWILKRYTGWDDNQMYQGEVP